MGKSWFVAEFPTVITRVKETHRETIDTSLRVAGRLGNMADAEGGGKVWFCAGPPALTSLGLPGTPEPGLLHPLARDLVAAERPSP